MNVAMMQPAFLPWQGFFELISKSDIFIFLDDFQFSIQSYHQRNRLFADKGKVDWYTVHVQKRECFKAPLNKTKINDTVAWRDKLWKRLQNNYAKAPFFDSISPDVKSWLFTEHKSLAEQNIAFIKMACSLMHIGKEFRYSSDYPTDAKRSGRVSQLLSWCQAKKYFCAKGSFGYMREDKVFPLDSVEVYFQDFSPQSYKQVGSENEFVPNLSVLDAFFNVGAEVTAGLVKSGTKKWLSWEEVERLYAAPSEASNNDGGIYEKQL